MVDGAGLKSDSPRQDALGLSALPVCRLAA